MDYFYIENNTPQGPLPASKLIEIITLDTPVWCSGMLDWQPAGKVEELAAMYHDYYTPPVPRAVPQPLDSENIASDGAEDFASDGAENIVPEDAENIVSEDVENIVPEASEPKPSNYLVWNVLASVLCCPLFAPGIFLSCNVDSLWEQGDKDGARKASAQAKIMAIVSVAITALSYLTYLLIMVMD
ncbi:MAG: CD225/dispanin family protein [Bacteroidales bacterium]|nr:CD225/dispanin family protein [Bacteroidales bacterium]